MRKKKYNPLLIALVSIFVGHTVSVLPQITKKVTIILQGVFALKHNMHPYLQIPFFDVKLNK